MEGTNLSSRGSKFGDYDRVGEAFYLVLGPYNPDCKSAASDYFRS